MISFAFAMIVVALIYAIGPVSGCQIIRWTRHRRGGLRGHHPGRPATGASINPARTIGPMLVQQIAGGTVRWGQLPIYVLAELAGAVAAGFLYSAIVFVRTTNRAVAPKQVVRTHTAPEGARS
jgi:Major intrinsic protein